MGHTQKCMKLHNMKQYISEGGLIHSNIIRQTTRLTNSTFTSIPAGSDFNMYSINISDFSPFKFAI